MKQAILFDLDGTLLPMDQEEFTNGYFRLLAAKMAPYGYDPGQLVDALWQGVGAMVKNDGGAVNSERFWAVFDRAMGKNCRADEPVFDGFYRNEFRQAVRFTQPSPLSAELVRMARRKAERVILATNPIFPRCGQVTRLGFVGLSDTDFHWVTDYENSRFCKPNPAYYQDILARFGLNPGECVMVGNDMEEDIVPAAGLGMETFLVTDCLINPKGRELPAASGTKAGALAFLSAL